MSNSLNKKQTKAQQLFRLCQQQNHKFKQWAFNQNWQLFHKSHYDWWAFPIDQESSYGNKYKVDNYTKEFLIQNQHFLTLLAENAKLVCLSWGFNIETQPNLKYIELIKKNKYQTWQNWPIRLYKMAKSLKLFGLNQYFQSVCRYGKYLKNQKYNFTYKNKNLALIFQNNINSQKHQIQSQEKTQKIKYQHRTVYIEKSKMENQLQKPLKQSNQFRRTSLCRSSNNNPRM